MKTIASNTIVKNGMPFIGLVLSQAEPFMDHMVVTLSMKADKETKDTVETFAAAHPKKVELTYEDVKKVGELTQVRQNQVDMCKEDWILFLDDDDFWPSQYLKEMVSRVQEASDNIDAFSVAPWQVLDKDNHNALWWNRSFTKWFKNEGINYKGKWPRDLIYKSDICLHWRNNPEGTVKVGKKFYHLSHIKDGSWRTDKGEAYKREVAKTKPTPFTVEEKALLEPVFLI